MNISCTFYWTFSNLLSLTEHVGNTIEEMIVNDFRFTVTTLLPIPILTY